MSGGGPSGAVDHAALFRGLPTAYLVMDPDLVIVEANLAYCEVLGRTREDLVGVPVFEAFPPDPGALGPDGSNPLEASFVRARDTGRPDVLTPFRYDVLDAATGRLEERTWSLITAPVLDEQGRATWLLQRVEDITDYVREREGRRAEVEQTRRTQERADAVEAELFVRARQLRSAQDKREMAVRRLEGLVDVAAALTAVQSAEDLEEVVVDRAPALVGADGAALVRASPDGSWRATPAPGPQAPAPAGFLEAPRDSPLPACWSARTGERLLLPTPAAAAAFHPAAARLHEATGRSGWALVPLVLGEQSLGCLVISWTAEHVCSGEELGLLEALAAQCAQALGRVLAARAEREAAAAVAGMSEALQRALLTEPVQPAGVRVVARYLPAAHHARVGGDWYDAFDTAAGTTTLVVGDVSGHDREAAAVMAQLRNLVRGVGHALGEPPAAVLTALDEAVRDLRVGALATAVLVQLPAPAEGAEPGGARRLRWSNAGHPPPLVVRGGGGGELLEVAPELLLGVDAGTHRSDHELVLEPGSTLVLYTDGLVEGRRRPLREGLDELVSRAGRRGPQGPEELCDQLLAEMLPAEPEDDVVVLAVHVLPGGPGSG